MKFIGLLVVSILVGFIIAGIASFCVMMGMGNVHDWWNFIPSMGFWDAFSITVWFAVPLSIYSGYNRSSND